MLNIINSLTVLGFLGTSITYFINYLKYDKSKFNLTLAIMLFIAALGTAAQIIFRNLM